MKECIQQSQKRYCYAIQVHKINKDLNNLTKQQVFKILHLLLCNYCEQHCHRDLFGYQFKVLSPLFSSLQFCKLSINDMLLMCNCCSTSIHFLCVLKIVQSLPYCLQYTQPLKYKEVGLDKKYLIQFNLHNLIINH